MNLFAAKTQNYRLKEKGFVTFQSLIQFIYINMQRFVIVQTFAKSDLWNIAEFCGNENVSLCDTNVW